MENMITTSTLDYGINFEYSSSPSSPPPNISDVLTILPEIVDRLRQANLSSDQRNQYCSISYVINYISSNNSGLGRPEERYINNRPALRMFFYFLYALIFIIGICGNTLVCYAVMRNKQMHTVTNLFITNLALSDILLCILGVPITPLYLIYFQNWVFGPTLCSSVPFAQGVSVYISAFTLMSIAIDRYFVIIYPFKPRMKISICLMIVTFVWLAAGLLTLPYALNVSHVPSHSNPCHFVCDELWDQESDRKAFGLSTSVLQFVVPFIIISFCYIRVCGKLSDRARSKPGEKSLKRDEAEKERTRRTNRMLIAMVIIFGASWLPLNSYNLIMDFYIPAHDWEFARAFFFLVHAIAMSSTCYNPFLYAWLNENFRKEFKLLLPCYSHVLRTSSVSTAASASIQMVQKNVVRPNLGESLNQQQQQQQHQQQQDHNVNSSGGVRKSGHNCNHDEEIHL